MMRHGENERSEWAGLQTFAAREAVLLAAYAMHSVQSRGRRYGEPEHAYRSPFQRDRDRVLHSAAYRRLSGKMQVFTGEMGDYHRTRLTHTQEVASIARTIGRALRLNEDLIEALALLHDIGHPPFGHAGEQALDECLAGQGGFSHNRYALTLAEELETHNPGFPGLNLTREVLEGQAVRAEKQAGRLAPLLEVQVVDAADSITYDAHDADDAVKLGLVPLDELETVPLVQQMAGRVRRQFGNLQGKLLRKAIVHELIDYQVNDVLRTSGTFLAASQWDSAQAARHCPFRIGPGQALAQQKAELEQFLYQRVYRHAQLIQVRAQAQQRLRALFQRYSQQPERMPDKFQRRIARRGLALTVGDYLAGMTDRFCDQQFRRLCQPGARVVLPPTGQ